jgi:hypothetical protein
MQGVTGAQRLSRAGMEPQGLGMSTEIVAAVDKAMQLSRASLMRELGQIFGSRGSLLGQAGP